MRILITGGAGFIGSHLADHLIADGHQVRAVDLLSAQVHGDAAARPSYLHPAVDLIRGDVRDADTLAHALNGIEAVYHFAAAVGVGQSMYEIRHYMSTNTVGTAMLLEALVKRPVQRLVVASSMSLYGEGAYTNANGQVLDRVERSPEQLRAGQWEPTDSDGSPLVPIPTPEDKVAAVSSVYALSKYDQERLCLLVGRAYGIETVALRFFNVYGPRQSLANPYTGVLAIFASRLMSGRPPVIFEDGNQRRDFVSARDVVQACQAALTTTTAVGRVFNIGSGTAHSVNEVAALLGRVLATRIEPEVCGKYRVGDIRHCFADITRAQAELGYRPKVDLESGLSELAEWLSEQSAVDRVADAGRELASRGLTV